MIGKSKTDRNILLCYKVQCYFASTSSIPCTNILYAHELKKAYTHRHVYLLKNLYHNVLNNEHSLGCFGVFSPLKKRELKSYLFIYYTIQRWRNHTQTHTHTHS